MTTVFVKINRPIDYVWGYFTTPSNWIEWYGGVKEVIPGWTTGAKIVWASGVSSPLTKVISGKEICMSGAWMDVTYRFKSDGNVETIVEVVESDPKGGSSFTDGGAANKAKWEKTLQKLKGCIEKDSQISTDGQGVKIYVKERGDIDEARQILGGNNVFGPGEWKRFFGDAFQVATVPEIPWNVDILNKPEIDQPHFLFLGIEKLGERPLDWNKKGKNNERIVPVWEDLYGYGRKTHPTFGSIIELNENYANVTCGFRWYFMPIGNVKKSDDLSYDQQRALLPSNYEVPFAIERITANILFFLLSGKYIDLVEYNSQMNRVCDQADSGRVLISGHAVYGIILAGSWADDPRQGIGITASRKI